jgi:hypothetical protein
MSDIRDWLGRGEGTSFCCAWRFNTGGAAGAQPRLANSGTGQLGHSVKSGASYTGQAALR